MEKRWKTNREKPELLIPAKDLEVLRTAVNFGADAVYGALPEFGLRAYAGNFTWEQLAEALSLVHGMGKKFYLTMNMLPFQDEMDDFAAAARRACELGVDAAILGKSLYARAFTLEEALEVAR